MSISSNNPAKVAVIGEKTVVQAFKALDWEIFDKTEPKEIKQLIKTLTQQQYSIILITENRWLSIPESERAFDDAPYPIILPIPDGIRKLKAGQDKIKQNLEKTVGGIK